LWPHMERAALNGQAVPHDYCDRWRAHLSVDAPPEDQTGWYNRALHEQASEVDSHPTVLERVYALNVQPDAFPRCETDSTGLLGADRSTIEDLVNCEWQENHAAEWSLAAERGALLTEAAYHTLDDANTDNTLRQASALDDLGRRSAAIDLLRPLVAAEPERDDARFELARLLLAVGNDEGVRHIDAVIESNERFRISGVAYATNFMVRKGRFDEAERYQCVARESKEAIENAARERSELTDEDEFLPHELDMPYVVRLQDLLGSIDQIRVAYLVRKRLEYDLGDQIYVLAIEAPQKLFGRSLSDEELRELLESDLILPGEAEIAFLNGWKSWLRPRLVGIRSACIHHAG